MHIDIKICEVVDFPNYLVSTHTAKNIFSIKSNI